MFEIGPHCGGDQTRFGHREESLVRPSNDGVAVSVDGIFRVVVNGQNLVIDRRVFRNRQLQGERQKLRWVIG